MVMSATQKVNGEAEEHIKLSVQGISCGGCVRHVTHAIGAVPGARVEEVTVGSARVAIDPARTSQEAVVAAIREAGFGVGELTTPGQS
jgi:copper chaperone